MNRSQLLVFGLLIGGLISCQVSKNSTGATAEKSPKNIILMIGDGMGVSHVSAGLYANKNRLNLEKFPVIGLHKSYASNDLITDSAAGATAFACGVKTYNGAIGVNKDTVPVPTFLEEMEQMGKATGLIATSTITHATPASFIAHQPLRQMYEEIAADFLETDIDLIIGGGKKFFERRDLDDRNLSEEFKKKGYRVFDFFNLAFSEIDWNSRRKLVYYTSEEQPLPVEQGRDYLGIAATYAPQFLRRLSDRGFFLMIEGSQIDWGGHANNSDYLIKELIDFDQAIGRVLTFAKADKETLVIVTADHECGGYSVNQGSEMGNIKGAFTTDYHTADLVPVFAYGPGSERFAGIYENTEIYQKMREALGLERVKRK